MLGCIDALDGFPLPQPALAVGRNLVDLLIGGLAIADDQYVITNTPVAVVLLGRVDDMVLQGLGLNHLFVDLLGIVFPCDSLFRAANMGSLSVVQDVVWIEPRGKAVAKVAKGFVRCGRRQEREQRTCGRDTRCQALAEEPFHSIVFENAVQEERAISQRPCAN